MEKSSFSLAIEFNFKTYKFDIWVFNSNNEKILQSFIKHLSEWQLHLNAIKGFLKNSISPNVEISHIYYK